MSRCRCCNSLIQYERMNKKTKSPEELCSACLAVAMSTAYNLEDDQKDSDELFLDIMEWDLDD